MLTLEELRVIIDRADDAILEAISTHLQLALEVERVKRETDAPIICLERKDEKLRALIARGAALNPPLDANLVTALWELLHGYYVMEELRQREKESR
jgi:chorismate mutase